MLSRTKVHDKKSVRDELKNFLYHIEGIWRSTHVDSKIALLQEGMPRTSKSIIVALLSYKPKNRLENVYKQMLLDYLLKSEKASAFSSDILLNTLINLFKASEQFDSQKIREKIDQFLHYVNEKAARPRLATLENFLHRNFKDEIVEIVLETLNNAGVTGKISFSHENIPIPMIKCDSKYIFPIVPEVNLLMRNENQWKRENVSVVCIEGFIEKVAEIDCILSTVSEMKKPLLIVCLGCSPEVVSTILTNNMRGTLDVMVVCPHTDEESINDISDIATASASQFFGFQTGAISTTFDEEILKKNTSSITVNTQQVSIGNNVSSAEVMKRVENIRKSLGESNEKDEYLFKRIRSLTSNQVKIIFPESAQQSKFSQIEEVDVALRGSKALIKYGEVLIDDENMFAKKGHHLYSSIYAGMKFGYSLYKELNSISAAIIKAS